MRYGQPCMQGEHTSLAAKTDYHDEEYHKQKLTVFSGKGCTKKPDAIDERDVKMAAYTNCLNNGIKRLIPGLRGLDIKALEKAGFDTSQIKGYTFKSGSQGGNSGKAEDSGIVCEGCGAPITQKVAAFSQNKFGKALCMNCQKNPPTEEKA